MYKIVQDESEMKWFFDHVIVPPRAYETYMVCLAARNKKLDEDERKTHRLGRGEMMRTELIRRRGGDWNFNVYKQAAYKYNCDENAMLTKSGLPYPQKSLVCYACVNPADELDCVNDTFQFYERIQYELLDSYRKASADGVEDHLEKLPKIFEHLRSCHATNISRRVWRDFDCDATNKDAVLPVIKKYADEMYRKGNFAVIETEGGFHTLVKVDAIKSDPREFIEKVNSEAKDFIVELKLSPANSQFIPLPGTAQYEKTLVKVINKDDFEK